MDIILKGGEIVAPQGSKKADVEIKEGKISRIGEGITSPTARIIDVSGNLLFPGFIDTHTHFKLDAGDFFTADDFYTGTKAAIAGGTTVILDFATQNKGETLCEALENWHKKAENQCSCDYSFHMSITQWTPEVREELKNMTGEGITSYKLYMAYDNLKVRDNEILEVLKAVSEQGGIVGVHCENGDLINELISEEKKKGNLSSKAHPLSRPDEIEAEAVNRLLTIARLAEAPVNIVHLSSTLGYKVIERARLQGQKVYVETCPQYLLLDDSKYLLEGFEGAKYVLSPPLRKEKDIACLWQALRGEKIETIGTDHCSFNFKEQKERGLKDFSKIPNGIPGVEHRPVLLYTFGVKEGKLSKEQLCALLSTNAAKLFGMYPQKGAIQEGSDGDIVVWNPEFKGVITNKEQLQNVDYTPYEGMKTFGRAEYVFLRGIPVVEQGRVLREREGRFIPRGRIQDF